MRKIALLLLFLTSYQSLYLQDVIEKHFNDNLIVRFIRIYGEKSETNPPVVTISSEYTSSIPAIVDQRIIIEFDVMAVVPPSLYAKFYHCSIDWEENENIFLNDITLNRTSNIIWEPAPISSRFYNFRGKITVPNDQVKFSYSGNWKVKLFEYRNPEKVIAESRFFVVKPILTSEIRFFSNFYYTSYNVTNSAYDIEIVVQNKSKINLIDNNVHSVVIYRNNRWNEPLVISTLSHAQELSSYLRYKPLTNIFGFLQTGKFFRIEGIPAENEYRVLDLTDIRLFPATNAPIRLPLSDVRRRGSFTEFDNDGAMVSYFVNPSYDDYLLIEFILDPEGWISSNEVFIAGSFNNWNPNRNWQLQFDEKERLYKLRQFVRRARHNYMYATGVLNYDANRVEKISFEEYEGNTVTSNHTFLAFVYYRNPSFGGYDEIIGIAVGNYLSTPFR
ncbi:MAG: type IX secretion system plug protein domain-containing protein [Candidatus Kapaibacteriales bacterium]